jgi:hypothetical protein
MLCIRRRLDMNQIDTPEPKKNPFLQKIREVRISNDTTIASMRTSIGGSNLTSLRDIKGQSLFHR